MPRGASPGERRGGRTKGTRNKRTVDGEAYARAIVEDVGGIEALRKQFRRGTLPPALLLHLWQLAYGTPKELTLHAITVVSNGHAPGTQSPPTETTYRLIPS